MVFPTPWKNRLLIMPLKDRKAFLKDALRSFLLSPVFKLKIPFE
ncbi:hypothetical protein B4119_0782 [Parageobacillus caldoxylosilyticus]|uniref:Uncharacterized protein n=1 Tax=Saccharococcus caldoxylosilyticus TaxID=81408 RepID=A0A150M0K1_9BACL|nr:hypothetical protein B4119_0782 [Parageobacillus caldoxylosilyticus]